MLVPADFIRSTEPGNRGRLSLSLFPGYTLETLGEFIQALLTVAYAEPRVIAQTVEEAQDRLVQAYVYASAYDEALLLAATRPTETSLDDLGTRKVDVKNLTAIITGWRKEWLAVWDADPSPTPAPPTQGSVTVPMSPGW